jgi:hypothetical protein
MGKAKQETITFKADESLLEVMKGIPNRSAFIRSAVLAALDGICPLCRGTGILTPEKKQHWAAIAETHSLEECEDCHEIVLVCDKTPTRNVHANPNG